MSFEQENKLLCLAFETIQDGICISSLSGETLWLNRENERMLGINRKEFFGESTKKFVQKKLVTSSITEEVISNKKTIHTVQEYSNGKKYLATGTYIYDENSQPLYILVHTRNITDVTNTSNKLEEAEALLRKYSSEIRKLKIQKLKEDSFIGEGDTFKHLKSSIEQAASVNSNVLIIGETGVGKNVVTRHIHDLSERSHQPLIHINCGAIPENLVESELFGYKGGAFSGANKEGKLGLVEKAHKGTLFLDEIGELPLHIQPKLLQFLQSGTFLRVGDTVERKVDVRIIAATNNDLLKSVEEKRFRADLYFRLNVLSIYVKPLRERKEDIIPIFYFYLSKYNSLYSKSKTLDVQTLDLLQEYSWPGNIRELENLAENLAVTVKSEVIMPQDLPDYIYKNNNKLRSNSFDLNKQQSLTTYLEKIEKDIITEVLENSKSTREAAEKLGISQSLLMRRKSKYAL